ncbi:uncharacterized protein LOC144175667 [Haemaphysalis longicornis]
MAEDSDTTFFDVLDTAAEEGPPVPTSISTKLLAAKVYGEAQQPHYQRNSGHGFDSRQRRQLFWWRRKAKTPLCTRFRCTLKISRWSKWSQVGRETGASMAVPLTQFLLLLQMTYSFPSCEILACCDALGNGADPQRKETLSVNVTAINSASVNDEDWNSTCAVDDLGQCSTAVYEPWDLGSTFGLQKAGIASALLGRGTGAAMAVPLTQFLLLLQVSDLLPRQMSVFVLPVPPKVVYDCIKKQALLRPRRRCCFSLLRRAAFYFLLLICCGDVELNPGPDKLLLILDGQAVINSKLDNIEAKQVAPSLALDDLKKRMSTLESKIAAFSNLEAVVNESLKAGFPVELEPAAYGKQTRNSSRYAIFRNSSRSGKVAPPLWNSGAGNLQGGSEGGGVSGLDSVGGDEVVVAVNDGGDSLGVRYESVKPSLRNSHVETAAGLAEEVEVYRGEDSLQKDSPYAAGPSDDNDERDHDDCD